MGVRFGPILNLGVGVDHGLETRRTFLVQALYSGPDWSFRHLTWIRVGMSGPVTLTQVRFGPR